MPYYFVDFVENGISHVDDEGVFFCSLEVARTEAVLALVQTVRDNIRLGCNQKFSASIRNEAGEELYRASLTFEEEILSTSDPPAGQKRQAYSPFLLNGR